MAGQVMLAYTFDIKKTVKVYIPKCVAGVPGDDPDERALKEAGREFGHDLYWNDVTITDFDEIEDFDEGAK